MWDRDGWNVVGSLSGGEVGRWEQGQCQGLGGPSCRQLSQVGCGGWRVGSEEQGAGSREEVGSRESGSDHRRGCIYLA